ncbi:hypothetical protein JI739_07770 [Ramlibacter sp. AW1]|uniref:Uncharacterized protein n=1 Tax=Ramlibacter aurantiacus TaxID=2801330 RepID=A0A936ZHA7_9BURK|nr:hypothetical protein [Ramlibacter aurantiacus]MBL0420238.1 hypothetical protein [Ramlibacter aurantiacus]
MNHDFYPGVRLVTHGTYSIRADDGRVWGVMYRVDALNRLQTLSPGPSPADLKADPALRAAVEACKRDFLRREQEAERESQPRRTW